MMKRTGVPRLGPDEPTAMPTQSPAQIQQAGASNMHTLAQSAQPILGATTMLSVGGVGGVAVGGFTRAAPRSVPPVMSYMKPNVQYAAPKQQVQPRLKSPPLFEPALAPAAPGRVSPSLGPPAAQFQRLKVEDALSYLDQVKFKFNTQPQVYNDFLDIMKEFKSQTIDTPGVITRVSNLFKGHPELIVGFNTFLPPGYKIEVQSNGQVSVSMPSPTGLGAGGVLLGVHHAQPQLVHLLPVAQSVSSAIVHNLSVNATPANTLHHISQAHQQIEAAIHHTPGGGGGNAAHVPAAPPGQPVEFNHAIEYVNKIKSRFSRQPDKYKRFLEILHAYQRGHRDVKEPQAKQQTEQEVYSQVAKLFENQDDLLAEFGQFLPDAKAVTKPAPAPAVYPHDRTPPLIQTQRVEPEAERFSSSPPHAVPHQQPPMLPKHPPAANNAATPPAAHHHLKRSPSFTSSSQLPAGAPPAKKPRAGAVAGAAYADAAKLATLPEFNFFDRVKKALRSQHVYENFLRCLLLFTNEIISSSELLCVTGPFLCRHPELQKWLQDFVGLSSPPNTPTNAPANIGYNNSTTSTYNEKSSILNYGRGTLDNKLRYSPVGALGAQLRHERPQGDVAQDVDLSTCKRLGTSYCALPRDAAARRCSGRTPLCREVLNDTWVSFPTWSEDSTFVTSRKTQYEEYIYRCEDERFELDVVIETNAATIRVLEGVGKKLSRLPAGEAARLRLDDCLGGHSPTIHQRALRRIYGEKVAVDIIAGLKKNPAVAVPVVLRRLKAKEEEWREAQKGFNKQWRELNEKYYLKSLDHQGINFKQNDLKAMRSKTLYNEVEAAYAARRPGPHLVVDYNMQSRQEAIKIMRDAAELLIHHARRQTAIQKAEKRRIKMLLRRFLPDLFSQPRIPLSDDEDERSDHSNASSPISDSEQQPSTGGSNGSNGSSETRFVCSCAWYLFLRLHALLCQRLAFVASAAKAAAADGNGNDSAAVALRLKPSAIPATEPRQYYTALLDLVRGVLDGNTEPSAYEDAAREMFGIRAYPAYTLDKLVAGCVRQLQHCAAEPWSLKCAELCARGGMRGAHSLLRRARDALRPDHAAFLVRVRASDALSAAFTLLDTTLRAERHTPVFLRRNNHNHRNRLAGAPRPHAPPRPTRKGVPTVSSERERAQTLRYFRPRERARARAQAAGAARARRWQAWLRARAPPDPS
ncbi:paired amphipathic helix protein Sin3b isoform X3 [Plodia interpunctella]|uniref:paired amphipathic helix protein Sin3b isoform X3 n=1 Tax=Plodia interpunctella TaxID=58824 RepID=UPI002368B6E0|nr:paired amphipathic helix protein Sin3b isoform X3 [Plodia interpunctella]